MESTEYILYIYMCVSFLYELYRYTHAGVWRRLGGDGDTQDDQYVELQLLEAWLEFTLTKGLSTFSSG